MDVEKLENINRKLHRRLGTLERRNTELFNRLHGEKESPLINLLGYEDTKPANISPMILF
jgi:hypothetical protein